MSSMNRVKLLIRLPFAEIIELSLAGDSVARIAREHGCADGDGVCAERGGDDLRGFKAGLKGAALGFADDGVENQVARFHHAAAENYPLDVQ